MQLKTRTRTKLSMFLRPSVLALTAGASLALAASPALAYGAGEETEAKKAGSSEVIIGEIVVTARKKAEDILKTPVTVSALTSEDIEKRGIISIADVAENTPGLNLNNNASGRADRSFQQLVLRGFTPSSVLATTTSMFIDGVPVASPSALTSISDPERIEVLKGPQSAYFGRNTFAGAMNIVNKIPSGEWGGSVSGMVGARNSYRVRGDIEGPIVGDKLTFRLSASKDAKDGSYKNAYDGGTLGDQSTKTATLLIAAKPIDSLTIKAFGLVSESHDGVAANSRISAYTVADASGKVVFQGQSNCKINGAVPYICGTTPKLANAVSSNTKLDAFIKNFLAQSRGRVLSPEDGVQGYGFLRRTQHMHIAADWALSDSFTLSYLTGVNREEWSQFSDLDGYDTSALSNPFGGPGSRSYMDFPYLVERLQRDYSHEARLTFDNKGKFHGVVGASYLDAWTKGSLGGGNGALGTTVFSGLGGKDRARTMGAFFGATYDVTSNLSASLEGRYQIDTLYTYASPSGLTTTSSTFIPAGTYAADKLIIKKTFKKFLPRLIVNYQISPNLMVYGSVAEGVNPAGFNSGILSQNDNIQTLAAKAGMKIAVEPEEVTNYELGLKGYAFDRRVRFSASTYYSQWRKQINNILLTVYDPVAQNTTFVSGSSNSGAVDMYGVEVDGFYAATNFLTLNFAGAINQSSIKKFVGPSVTSLTGVTDFDGKEQPNTSKYSAVAGAQFHGSVPSQADMDWFARVDWTYKSGVWSNQANIVKTQDSNVFNARAGISRDKWSIEAFVSNIFNEDAYTSVSDNWVFTPTFDKLATNSALLVGLREKRSGGVQAKYKF